MSDERQSLPEKAAEVGNARLHEIWATLMRGLVGFNPWQPARHRHSRMFTKAYADGRQRDPAWREHEGLTVGRHFVAPAPSAKARARKAYTLLQRALLKTKKWRPGSGWLDRWR